MFCHFDEGHYRWNDSFIEGRGSQYHVEKSGVRSSFATLGDAATAAGVTPDRLTQWIRRAEQGHIYCVETEPPNSQGDERYVQILLEGSAFDPYGLRYAPDARSYEYLMSFAKQNGSNMDYEMKHLEGRWFYFSARR